MYSKRRLGRRFIKRIDVRPKQTVFEVQWDHGLESNLIVCTALLSHRVCWHLHGPINFTKVSDILAVLERDACDIKAQDRIGFCPHK